MHWAASYLGKPWKPGACGPDAYDCWGLLRAVYRARAGIELPEAGVAQVTHSLRDVIKRFADDQLYGGWRKIDAPGRDLDGALMAQAKNPIHVGLWLTADGGKMLHAISGGGVVAMNATSLASAGFKVLAWYRHEDLA